MYVSLQTQHIHVSVQLTWLHLDLQQMSTMTNELYSSDALSCLQVTLPEAQEIITACRSWKKNTDPKNSNVIALKMLLLKCKERRILQGLPFPLYRRNNKYKFKYWRLSRTHFQITFSAKLGFTYFGKYLNNLNKLCLVCVVEWRNQGKLSGDWPKGQDHFPYVPWSNDR